MELLGHDPVSCVLATMPSIVLNDPCVAGLDAVDGAAGCMGLNAELGLLGAKPDVVGIGDWGKGYIPGHHMHLSRMSTSVATLDTAS